MMSQPDLFRPSIVQLAEAHRNGFPDDFLEWLPENLHVYHSFKNEALRVRAMGFDHYSARTIIEFMRHHTAVNESADGSWKINNNHPPYLARLFDLDCPDCAGLFEYRETKKVVTPQEQVRPYHSVA